MSSPSEIFCQGVASVEEESEQTFSEDEEVDYDDVEEPTFVPMELQDLRRKEVLGEGTFGKVYRVVHNKTGQTYAEKCIKKIGNPLQKKLLANEIEVLAHAKHPFLNELVQIIDNKTRIHFILDYLPGGDLYTKFERIPRKSGTLDLKIAKFYLGEVFLALEYLHNNDIIYRDLKPENIFWMGVAT